MPTTVRRKDTDTTAQVRVNIELVTPHKANDWLEKNRRNRPKREGQIERYIDQMKEDNWMVSPDAIAFDENGRLINGQHRLTAIVRAGEAQRQLVARGLDPDARLISDVGAKRTAGDLLSIEGFKRPLTIGAVVRIIALWLDDRLQEVDDYENVVKRRVVGLAERCIPRLYDSVAIVEKNKTGLANAMPRSLLTWAHFLYRPTYGETIDHFVNKVATGNGLLNWVVDENGEVIGRVDLSEKSKDEVEGDVVESPAQILRAKIEKAKEGKIGPYPRKIWLAYLIKAANWHGMKDPHSALRWTSKQSFPEPRVDMIPELQGKLEL